MREPKLNPLDRTPPPCPCGAPAARADADEAAKQDRPQRCHICRAIATEHPDWSGEQVTGAGLRKWVLLALTAIRQLATVRAGEAIADVVFVDRLVWVARDGYERLTIRGMEPALVLEVLAEAHPDLTEAGRHEGGGQLAVKLVVRKEGRHAA